MPIDRSKWKLPDLKAECRSRGIRIEGRKQELIDRLEFYDKNDDFRDPPIELPSAPKFPAVNESWFRTLILSDKDILPKVFIYLSTFGYSYASKTSAVLIRETSRRSVIPPVVSFLALIISVWVAMESAD